MIARAIPAPLHRTALRLAHALRRRWWRWFRPRLRGCRIIALDGEGRVLLIRHSYGSGQWMPPGGGVGRSELPLAAALRELAEEVALELHDPIEVAQVEEQLHGAGNTVHVIAGRAEGAVRVDGREVIEAAFFAPVGLPAAMPEQLHRELGGWIAAFHAGRRAGGLAP